MGDYSWMDEFVRLFPTPREVDRYLYNCSHSSNPRSNEFPAPLEADRYLYTTGENKTSE